MHFQLKDGTRPFEPGDVLSQRRSTTLRASLVTLVGEDAATRLLRRIGLNGLERMTAEQIVASAGVPADCAERVVAARTISTRLQERRLPTAATPRRIVAALPPDFATLEYEVVLGVALTNANRVKAVVVLAMGGISGAALFPRDVFVPILRQGAAALALCHNHPSGDPLPSREDILLTNTISRCAALLGVPLVDHIIVARDGFTSFAETGLLLNEAELAASSRSNARPPHGDDIPF